jgi:hypothetical protein
VVSRDVHRLRGSGAVEGHWGHVGVMLEGYGGGSYQEYSRNTSTGLKHRPQAQARTWTLKLATVDAKHSGRSVRM